MATKTTPKKDEVTPKVAKKVDSVSVELVSACVGQQDSNERDLVRELAKRVNSGVTVSEMSASIKAGIGNKSLTVLRPSYAQDLVTVSLMLEFADADNFDLKELFNLSSDGRRRKVAGKEQGTQAFRDSLTVARKAGATLASVKKETPHKSPKKGATGPRSKKATTVKAGITAKSLTEFANALTAFTAKNKTVSREISNAFALVESAVADFATKVTVK